MQNATTILFGLPGVAVERVERVIDEQFGGVRLVHVVTTASSASGCPSCGVISTSVKQYPHDQAARPALREGAAGSAESGVLPDFAVRGHRCRQGSLAERVSVHVVGQWSTP